MNLAEEISKLEHEVISIKTQQDTGGDSALLYRQVYNPGYVADVSRVHTIKCITDVELDNAIFMPILQGGLTVQAIEPDGVPLRDFSNEIIWIQYGVNSRLIGVDDTTTFAASGITIYSNVPFVISATVS